MKRVMVFSISLMLSNCQHNELLTIRIDPDQGYTNFIVENPQFKTPLQITGDSLLQTGAIYYVTSEGINWVKGKPVVIANNSNKFYGKWNKRSFRCIPLQIGCT